MKHPEAYLHTLHFDNEDGNTLVRITLDPNAKLFEKEQDGKIYRITVEPLIVGQYEQNEALLVNLTNLYK